jgi:hypothetical protein
MINKDDRTIANVDINQSTLTKEESKNRIKAIFEKLSLSQNEETNNGNIDPRNLRNNQDFNENQDLANNPEQILQPKKEQSELSENIIFYPISPKEAQEVIGIIYDVKISGLEFSNKFLQEKLSKTTDPKEQKMLNEFIEKNNTAIGKANIDKLNQELNKQLQEIIEQSRIMDFIEQSEKYQKQRKAESNFALQTSPENNSQLGGILNDMGISFQTVSGEKDSSVLVIDQDVNNQMAVQNIEQQISQYKSQLQSQSQIPSQSQSQIPSQSQSQIPSQSQSQGGGWVKAVSSQSNSNQTSISTNTVTSRPVVGAHTAALASRNQSGVVLATKVNAR